MALNATQQAALDALLEADDQVPLPTPEIARQIQALLVPRVPRPDGEKWTRTTPTTS